MVLMNRGIFLLAVLSTLVSSVFGDVIHAKRSSLPAPQDSVFETPNAPDPAPRETDAGRWVIPLREVMQRTSGHIAWHRDAQQALPEQARRHLHDTLKL